MPPPPPELTFEDALHQLERIVTDLEGEVPSLESALEAYEQGVTLARFCQGRLQNAELRIQELALEDAGT
jgi:exodeoxyribonuclease VII small subunit